MYRNHGRIWLRDIGKIDWPRCCSMRCFQTFDSHLAYSHFDCFFKMFVCLMRKPWNLSTFTYQFACALSQSVISVGTCYRITVSLSWLILVMFYLRDTCRFYKRFNFLIIFLVHLISEPNIFVPYTTKGIRFFLFYVRWLTFYFVSICSPFSKCFLQNSVQQL